MVRLAGHLASLLSASIAFVSVAVACGACHAQTVGIFTVYGTVVSDSGSVLDDQFEIQVSRFSGGNFREKLRFSVGDFPSTTYSIVFIDTESNDAAGLGDVFRVDVISPGGQLNSCREAVVLPEHLEAFSMEIDVIIPDGILAVEGAVWSQIKALYR